MEKKRRFYDDMSMFILVSFRSFHVSMITLINLHKVNIYKRKSNTIEKLTKTMQK